MKLSISASDYHDFDTNDDNINDDSYLANLSSDDAEHGSWVYRLV